MARVGPQSHKKVKRKKKIVDWPIAIRWKIYLKKTQFFILFNVYQIEKQHNIHISQHQFIFMPYTNRPYRAIVRERE